MFWPFLTFSQKLLPLAFVRKKLKIAKPWENSKIAKICILYKILETIIFKGTYIFVNFSKFGKFQFFILKYESKNNYQKKVFQRSSFYHSKGLSLSFSSLPKKLLETLGKTRIGHYLLDLRPFLRMKIIFFRALGKLECRSHCCWSKTPSKAIFWTVQNLFTLRWSTIFFWLVLEEVEISDFFSNIKRKTVMSFFFCGLSMKVIWAYVE